jgi:iron complex outermembrane receptor protein
MRLNRPLTFALASLVLPALVPVPARAQVSADTGKRIRADSAYTLPTVTVTRTPEPLERAPVAAFVVDSATIRRGQLTVGLDEALANVPGVYVANRYNFSLDQRLSIRGFGSRANFGLRGVKVLLDGVPQTLPDGQSQLNNVDFGTLDRIEVLRGASSALYGNASGGIISLHSQGAGPEPFAQRVRAEYGSFGTDKWQSFTSARRGPLSGTLSVSRFTTTNFRQQGYADLRRLSADGQWAITGGTLLDVRFSAADDPHAQNPGALTPAEFAANPDSAAATNIRRGADKDVTQQQLSASARHTDAAGNQYELTLYGLLRDLDNPLATPPPGSTAPNVGTYVKIGRVVGGGRASTTYHLSADPRVPRVTGGVELQRLRDNRQNFTSISGAPTSTVLLDQREVVTELGPFAQVVWTPNERLLVGLGGRYDRVSFGVTDHYLGDGVDNSGSRVLSSWNWSAGASYVVHDAFVPYVNVSTSFETPTTTELANQPGSTGGFNTSLDPQKSNNYEAGFRGRVTRWATYTATVYRSDVRDAIIQYREVGGRAFFQNAGRTRNDGLELGVSVFPIAGIRVFGNYTFSNYRFSEYRIVTGTSVDTLDGNRVAGVPRNFARLGLRAGPFRGVALDVDQTITSSIYADDDNTLLVNGLGAGVTNARLSWDGRLGQASFAPFIGVNNIFDKLYVGSVTVNGTFNRVLEPAPRRNVYVGAEIGYRAK